MNEALDALVKEIVEGIDTENDKHVAQHLVYLFFTLDQLIFPEHPLKIRMFREAKGYSKEDVLPSFLVLKRKSMG